MLLPQEMQHALEQGEISEGHTRPLLMLIDKPQEQLTLFKEIIARRLTVRDTEQLARRVAIEKVRKTDQLSPDLISLEQQLTERLGTRVRIEKKEQGGKVTIDFFSPEDLVHLCMRLAREEKLAKESVQPPASAAPDVPAAAPVVENPPVQEVSAMPSDTDIYSVKNFTV